MKYLALTTASNALLSGLLYGLYRPWHLRSAGDTRYHSGKVTHPETGDVALELPQDTTLLLHEEATQESQPPQYLIDAGLPDQETSPLDALASMVEQWEGASAAQEVRDHYNAHISQQVLVVDLLPTAISDRVKTRSKMNADGWFPEPEI